MVFLQCENQKPRRRRLPATMGTNGRTPITGACSGNVVAQLRNEQPNNTRGNPLTPAAGVELALTYDGLLANLPTTEQQLQVSNDSIVSALYMLGRMYINDVEDYDAAVKTYEELRRRFPAFEPKDEVLFQLYYAYNKIGNSAKAAEIKNALNAQYAAKSFHFHRQHTEPTRKVIYQQPLLLKHTKVCTICL